MAKGESTSHITGGIIVFLAGTLFFAYLGTFRSLASDEGFYAIAARQVLRGYSPYLDFFYPQAPLLPYLYAAWFKLTGSNWQAARAFSALCSGLGTALFFMILASVASNRRAAVGVAMLLGSALVIAWFSTVKIFASSFLFLSAALYTADLGSKRNSKSLWLLSGLLLGFACGIRSYLIVCLLPFLFFFWIRKNRLTLFLWYFAGLTIGLSPHLVFLLLDADSYFYNNLGYHLHRSSLPEDRLLNQKLITVERLFGILPDRESPGFQYLLPVLFAVLSTALLRRKMPPVIIVSFLMAISIFAISLLPSPTWQQYFSLTVPFFILPAVYGFFHLSQKHKTLGYSLFGLWFCYHMAIGAVDFRDHLQEQKKLPGPEKLPLQPHEAMQISEMLDKIIVKDTEVLSFWPGHLLGSKAIPIAGMENQFWVRVPDTVTEEIRDRYHLMSSHKLRKLIKRSIPGAVITGKRSRFTPARLLESSGYELSSEVHEVQIWIRKSGVRAGEDVNAKVLN